MYGTPFVVLVSRSPALHADEPGGHSSRCHALCCDAVPFLVDLLQGRWVNRDEPGLAAGAAIGSHIGLFTDGRVLTFARILQSEHGDK